MTIEDVQDIAFAVMALPSPRGFKPNRDSAIYKYWLAHKELGSPVTYLGKLEIALEDGSTAVVLNTGRILHWLGGDDVEAL